ncbi:putative inactive tRNA-specific adenosine deaminase-like protein 3 [Aphomia sociella]
MEAPPIKKAKTDNAIIDNIDDIINKIKTSSFNLLAILTTDIYDTIPTEKVYVGQVKDAKDLSKAVITLNEKLPLKYLQHLKRVRKKKQVLLCPTSYLNHNSSIQEFLEFNLPELKNIFEYFKEVEVPTSPPKLKRQHTEWNKLWSCNFHPNAYLEKLSSDKFFKQDELITHRTFMAIAFDVAKFHLQKINNIDVTEIFEIMNVSIVVDPLILSIVAISIDNREEHPLQHSAMLAIDNVAKTQDGGVWDADKKCGTDNRLNGIDKDLLVYLKERYKVNNGARKFRFKDVSVDEKGEDDGPYLCTGYYVYSIREPCIMCSMALVHARVKRLFFCYDNTQLGAVKSKARLQNVQSLNHRFEVFTGFL